MGYAVFFLVILLSNIIQGITGFAGTILAMPPSLMLVGYDTAKPVLNVLGLLSGIYVFAGHRKHVCWGELKKIVAVMAAGIVGGIFLKGFFAGRERALYALLGLFVVCPFRGCISFGGIGLGRKRMRQQGLRRQQRLKRRQVLRRQRLRRQVLRQQRLRRRQRARRRGRIRRAFTSFLAWPGLSMAFLYRAAPF